MSSEVARLYAVLGADTSGLQQGLSGASDALSKTKSHISGLGVAAAGIAVAGVGALVGGLVASVQEAMAAQEGIAQLEAVIQSTGGKAGVTKDQIMELAGAIQKTTKFADDDVVAVSSMLLTFTNIGKDVFPQTTRTALDMAQALGMDGKQAAMMLGKALNDPIQGVGALRRVGVQLTDAQEASIKKFMAVNDVASAQKVILGELNTEFGGSAEAAGNTFAGKLAIAGHALDDVKEKIGNALLPVLAEGATKLSDFLASPELEAFTTKIGTAIESAATFVTSLSTGLAEGGDPFAVVTNSVFNLLTAMGMGPAESAKWAVGIGEFVGQAIELIQGVVTWVQTNWQLIEGYITSVFSQAVAIITPIINSMITIVQTVLGAIQGFIAEHGAEIQAFFLSAWTRVQGIIEGVMAIINATIVPLWEAIAGFISQNQDTIKAGIELVWNGIKLVIGTVLTVIETLIKTAMKVIKGDWSGAWEELKNGAVTVWEGIQTFFSTIPGKLQQIGKDIIEGIVKGINDAANTVRDVLLDLIKNAVDAVKAFFGIKSPSKLMAGIGRNIGAGLAQGILASTALVTSASDRLNDAVRMPDAGGDASAFYAPRRTAQWASQPQPTQAQVEQREMPLPQQAVVIVQIGEEVLERKVTSIVYESVRGAYA